MHTHVGMPVVVDCPGNVVNGTQEFSAIITQVHDGGMYVNLIVFPPIGAPYNLTSVRQANVSGARDNPLEPLWRPAGTR